MKDLGCLSIILVVLVALSAELAVANPYEGYRLQPAVINYDDSQTEAGLGDEGYCDSCYHGARLQKVKIVTDQKQRRTIPKIEADKYSGVVRLHCGSNGSWESGFLAGDLQSVVTTSHLFFSDFREADGKKDLKVKLNSCSVYVGNNLYEKYEEVGIAEVIPYFGPNGESTADEDLVVVKLKKPVTSNVRLSRIFPTDRSRILTDFGRPGMVNPETNNPVVPLQFVAFHSDIKKGGHKVMQSCVGEPDASLFSQKKQTLPIICNTTEGASGGAGSGVGSSYVSMLISGHTKFDSGYNFGLIINEHMADFIDANTDGPVLPEGYVRIEDRRRLEEGIAGI